MANQPESATYDAGVYQIETTDAVRGGVGGIANAPLLNLADRTAYLKQHVDNLENGTTIPPTVAPLNSPGLTGTPTAPTPPAGDSSTKVATTAFVQQSAAGTAVVNVAGNANVVLTQAQYGVGIIELTGALTGNISVIFPNNGKWIVANNTTGPYSITCKTAAGAGVGVTQGHQAVICADGTNVMAPNNDGRIRLTADVALYVSAAGSDANSGLSSTAPFATLQKAWNVLQQQYDLNGHVATVNIADGTYAAGLTAVGPIVGASSASSVQFVGNAGAPGNVIVATTGANCFSAEAGATFTVSGLTLQATGGSLSGDNGLCAFHGGIIGFSNIVFGACGNGQITTYGHGRITALGNYSISGSAVYHWASQFGGLILVAGFTITITGTPNYSSAFASATDGAAINASGNTYTGGATGARYNASANGVITTGGAGASALPGNAAGSTASGGQYV